MTNIDRSYSLLNQTLTTLETKFGEVTNVETLYEGRTNFKYEVCFCDDNNSVTVKRFNVYLGNEYVEMLKK